MWNNDYLISDPGTIKPRSGVGYLDNLEPKTLQLVLNQNFTTKLVIKMNEKLHITIKDNRLKVMINSNDTFGIFGSKSSNKTASITSHDWLLVFDNDTENLSPMFLSPESSILLVCDTIICKIHISVTTVNFTEPPRNDSLLDNTNIKSNKGSANKNQTQKKKFFHKNKKKKFCRLKYQN